ncbi:MAG: putative efflux family protein [Clostridiales bacterium]|jgi:putative MATE family efflux protein|nr:putative efflux family protein [Clostridiales bacterium]
MTKQVFNIFKINSKEEFSRIFQLSWPVMVGMILQSLLGTVDMMFISSLGTSQAAAASLGNTASGVVFVMSSLVSAGAIALIARSYGEGNLNAVKRFNGETLILTLVIGGILSILCYYFNEDIIRLMYNPEPGMIKLTSEYLSVILLGTVFVFLNSTLRTTLQAIGDTKTPLFVFGLSNIINIVLDYLFMFPMGMGIKGAAIATVISTIFSFLAINMVLIKKIYNSSISDFISCLRIQFDDAIRILKIGSWACIQQIARPITGLLMFRLVLEVGGDSGTAAFGIGGQLFNYTFIFLVGLSTAISIMVGQSLGKGDIDGCDRIIKEGMKLAIINMILFSIPYLIFPGFIMKIFLRDAAVVAIGVQYLRIVYLGVIFVIYPTIYGGVFQGAGDTFPPMISSLVANVVVKLASAYYLSKFLNLGINGVWAAIALSVIVEALIISIYFNRNRWKEKVI